MITDYSKYKRFFTFGCSFTGYKYPTWADIMSVNIPHARFYNFGQSGGGNTFIANRITEANHRFKFCETDLIMVMYSTYCREDRYHKERGWVTPGNVYTQAEYDFTDPAYLCNWGDPLTYLVRDISIIDVTNAYLKLLPCDSISMLSVPFDYQQDKNNPIGDELIDTYSELVKSFPTDMFTLEMNKVWGYSCAYMNNGELFYDYHPSPKNYYNYLSKIGIPMSEKSLDYVNNATEILKQVKEEPQFQIAFPNIDPRLLDRKGML